MEDAVATLLRWREERAESHLNEALITFNTCTQEDITRLGCAIAQAERDGASAFAITTARDRLSHLLYHHQRTSSILHTLNVAVQAVLSHPTHNMLSPPHCNSVPVDPKSPSNIVSTSNITTPSGVNFSSSTDSTNIMIDLERALDRVYDVFPYIISSVETMKAIQHAQQLLHQWQHAHQQYLQQLLISTSEQDLDRYREECLIALENVMTTSPLSLCSLQRSVDDILILKITHPWQQSMAQQARRLIRQRKQDTR